MNIEEFENLYKLNYVNLLLVSFRIVKDRTMAEDIVQNFFESVWKKKETLILHGNFRLYGLKAVKNLSLKQLEQRKKERDLLQKKMIPRQYDFDNSPNLIESKLEKASKIIEGIPESRRNIFLDYVLGGLSYKEIADMRNISINTVKVQMQRAYDFIRKAEIDKIASIVFCQIVGNFL